MGFSTKISHVIPAGPQSTTTLQRYLRVAVYVLVAFLFRLSLTPWVGDNMPFSAFTVAAIAAAWYGGFWPGITACALGITLGVYQFVRYFGSFVVEDPGDYFVIASSTLVTLLAVTFTSLARAQILQSKQLADTLRESEQRLRDLAIENLCLFQNAKEDNTAKDRFVTVLGHQLRTQLETPLSLAGAIEADAAFPDDVRAKAAEICREVRIGTHLIDSMLDVAKITGGKIEVKREEIDVTEVLDRAVKACTPDLAARNLQLVRNFEPGDRRVLGDSTLLQKVFEKLLGNAIKYSSAGGSVSLRSYLDPLGNVVTEFTDKGAGISAEILPYIFSAYERPGASTAKQPGGLTISDTLVKLQGGKISVASFGKGRGTTFRVLLPAINPATPTAAT